MKQRIASISYAGVVACSVMFSGIASAVDFNITGFVRQEIGVSIAGNANELNDAGSPWNNRIVPHLTYESWGTQVANPDLGVGAIGQFVGPTVGVNSLLPVSIHPTGAFAGGAASAVAAETRTPLPIAATPTKTPSQPKQGYSRRAPRPASSAPVRSSVRSAPMAPAPISRHCQRRREHAPPATARRATSSTTTSISTSSRPA